jgi:heptosyltransferase-1
VVERSLFREWPKYAAAVASDLAAPLLRLWADGRAIGPATPPGEWRRVVMLGSTHIGDVMYRTPSLAYLKRALPHCEVSYVTSPLTAALVETNPAVDVVLPIAETGPAWRRDMTRVLRSYRFDAAICTDNISYHRDLLLVARSGIPARIGFAHKGFSALVTDAVPAPTRLPAPAYTRALIAHVCRLDPTWDLTPVLATTPEDEQRADTVWRDLGLGAAPVTIACAMTLRQVMTATWPPRSFIAALSDVARDIDLEVVLCGSTADGPLLRDAARRAPFPCRVAAGTLTLRAIGALFRRWIRARDTSRTRSARPSSSCAACGSRGSRPASIARTRLMWRPTRSGSDSRRSARRWTDSIRGRWRPSFASG